jgi:hypothetical protein
MSVEWKPGMVDTDGVIILHPERAWPGAELDYAHPSNVGHILAHVHERRPGVAVSLYYHPDAGAGWCGEIDDWHTYGTLPDVLRAMVGRVSDV